MQYQENLRDLLGLRYSKGGGGCELEGETKEGETG